MKKRLLALFIIPLLAVGIFFGCAKDSRSLEESRSLYVEMIDSYITKNASEEAANFMFKSNISKYNPEASETQETHENVLYIVFGDNSAAASAEMKALYNATRTASAPPAGSPNPSISNVNKLFQFTAVYQSITSIIFQYYETWQESFYANLKDNEDVTQEDVDALYYAVKDLKEEVATFYAQKILFEEEVKAFGTGNAIVGASIEVLNYHYNQLVKKAFKFINIFIDMQNAYFPMEKSQLYYASMVYHQSAVHLAQAIFYSNIVSMESGEYCSIKHLTYKKAAEGNSIHYLFDQDNFIEGVDIKGVVDISASGEVSVKDCGFISGKSSLSADDISKIDALKVTNKNFNQRFAIYLKACKSFPLYESKCAYFGLEEYSTSSGDTARTLNTFVNKLSYENESRFKVIDLFDLSATVRFALTLSSFTVVAA